VPDESLPIIQEWFNEYDFHLRISKSRSSKYGDFRPAYRNQPNRISVNGDLNQYHFLLTLTHEVAHAAVWKQYKNRVNPHGKEWKGKYAELLTELMLLVVFPKDLKQAIDLHLQRPKASSCNDPELYKTLKKYDAKENIIYLEDIPENSSFLVQGKRKFIKGKKRRTRFECIEIGTKKTYLITGHSEVELLS